MIRPKGTNNNEHDVMSDSLSYHLHGYRGCFLFFFLSFTMWHVPSSRTSAEACFTGWPNAQPQGWNKWSVVRHHQACLTVPVMSNPLCLPDNLISKHTLL